MSTTPFYAEELHTLYVEDNKEQQLHTSELLRHFFGRVTIASDGEEGLAKFKEDSYDIVLTDINMPKMNGIKMIARIKELDEHIPMLILSAHDETDYLIDAISLGVDGYLLKPLNIEHLARTLKKSVEKILMQKELAAYRRKLETANAELEEKVDIRTAELEHRLCHDALTELKNHTAMMHDIPPASGGTLFLIDIDGFQTYNELYGLHAGNKILKAFTELLQGFNHEHSFALYRAYGDGFVLYKKTDHDPSVQQGHTGKLLALLEDFSVHIDEIDETVNIDSTVAVAVDEANLFEAADMALRHAKKNKQALAVYTDEMNTTLQLANDLYWQSEIKKALEQDGIIPVFQGVVDREQKIVKYEALIRLVQEENGARKLVTPFHFLESAKKTKQYEKLTRTMIQKSFSLMQTLTCDFSVNLSFEDISNPDLVTFLEEEIVRYGIGSRLIIEILESETVDDYALVRSVIERLRKHAVRIAIDDFGSGFSNFEHILNLNPEYIKIDGSLIKNILDDKNSLTLVKAIAEFSKELGIKVIAEFVSSKEIFDILKELSIDEYQGYYFSIPSEDING